MLTIKRLYWEGRPGGEQDGEGTQENRSAVARGLGFYGGGISVRVVFGQSF